jgi:hypothetical protein
MHSFVGTEVVYRTDDAAASVLTMVSMLQSELADFWKSLARPVEIDIRSGVSLHEAVKP